MSVNRITERQKHWLNHIQATDASDGTLFDYVKSEGLKVNA